MKNLSMQLGIGNVGVFFTVSMLTMIAVRLFGAAVFDRFNKSRLALFVLGLLTVCLIALPDAETVTAYYLLAAVYGVSIGVALPLLNALLFSASEPALRGLNTNMALFTMDAGYFLTSYLGGMLIALGANFGALFYAAGFCSLLCLTLILVYAIKGERKMKP